MEGKGALVRTLTPTLSQREKEQKLPRVWMMRHPVPGDLFTSANPHVLVCHDMIEKPLQARGTAGMTSDAHMQAN